MLEYVFKKYGLPIFDATGAVTTLNSTGQPVDPIGNVVTITTAYGLPNDGALKPRTITQPTIPIQVASLVYFITSQAVRIPQAPTTTPKFARTPGRVNLKIIDNKTKADEALNKRATRSLYSDSEGRFSLTSEGLISFVRLLTGHAKSCGWEIFDVHISTTGPTK